MLTKCMTCEVIQSLVMTRLDYCNGLLCGIPHKLMDTLQHTQNATARVVTRTRRDSHITPIRRDLHWLPFRHRVDFKFLLIVTAWAGTFIHCCPTVVNLPTRARATIQRERGLLVEHMTNLSTAGDRTFTNYVPSV